MNKSRQEMKIYDHPEAPREIPGRFDAHTNGTYSDGTDCPSCIFENSACNPLDENAESFQETSRAGRELIQCQKKVVQMEVELSACRGQIMGWRNRCCIAEDALENRRQDHEKLIQDVGILRQNLDTMQKMTESQDLSIRSMTYKVDVISTVALALSAISICLALTGMHK